MKINGFIGKVIDIIFDFNLIYLISYFILLQYHLNVIKSSKIYHYEKELFFIFFQHKF